MLSHRKRIPAVYSTYLSLNYCKTRLHVDEGTSEFQPERFFTGFEHGTTGEAHVWMSWMRSLNWPAIRCDGLLPKWPWHSETGYRGAADASGSDRLFLGLSYSERTQHLKTA